MVRQIAASGSPIGRALAGYEVTRANLTPDQIGEQLNLGTKVLMIGLFRDGEGYQGHAVHLGRTGERLISVSDGGIEVRLPEESKRSVILFRRK